MNVTQQGVIALMKSAVTQQPLPLPEGFDLEEACAQIRGHHMVPLIYDGAVRCGIPAGHPVMQHLFRGYCKALQVSEGQMRELGRIFAAFEENGIDYLPLKGCKMKALYPKPELRMMGDADVLIRMDQYPRIVPIMEGLGFTYAYESDHELVWKSRELSLELHKRVIPSYNEDYFAYFGDGWQLAAEHTGCRYSMTPEDEFLFLFTHFAKHFRDGGIGCRYVLDLWMYLRANPGLDMDRMRAELEKLRLWEFYENIRRLIGLWFGDGEPDPRSLFLTDFVFSSGSWGESVSKSLSMAVRDSHGGGFWRGRVSYLLQTAFPSAQVLDRKYTVLRKAPWLLPAVWVVRPFYKVLFEFRSLGHHGRNLRAMTEENLDGRQRMLRYVGLDYNF